MKKKSFKISLAWQILIALVLGITLGAILHNVPNVQLINIFGFEKTIVNPNVTWTINTILQPAGDLFIRLIKMIVVPIVLSSIVVGVAGIGDSKKLGRIGVKTIVYFEIITTVAIVVGITFANVFHPGTGIDISTLTQTDISQYASATAQVTHENHFVQTLMSLVPTNIFAALMRGDMLAIIFFAVLFGVALSSIPAAKRDRSSNQTS